MPVLLSVAMYVIPGFLRNSFHRICCRYFLLSQRVTSCLQRGLRKFFNCNIIRSACKVRRRCFKKSGNAHLVRRYLLLGAGIVKKMSVNWYTYSLSLCFLPQAVSSICVIGGFEQVRLYPFKILAFFWAPCFLGVFTSYDKLPCFGPPRL